MKFAKLAVIGQLVVSGVLLGVFVLKSSSGAGDAHAKEAAAHAAAIPGTDAGAAAEGEHHAKGAHGGEQAKDNHGKDNHGKDDHADKSGHGPEAAGGVKLASASAGKGARATKDGHKDAHDEHAAPQAVGLAGDPKAIARALLDGNTRFVAGGRSSANLEQQRAGSAGGQHPGAMVLGCADSRVPPELVFDRGIGELFVVRSAGNIAEPVAVGSLEYAHEHLHAKVLLVLGHEKCGAVQAALSEEKMPTPNLEAVVGYIAPGIKGLKSWAEGPDLVRMAVEANVRRQAEELLRRSPLLRQAVAKGEVTILKAVYDLETGRVRPI